MGSVLSEIEEGRTPQLLLNDQRLLQKLEPPSQELVLDLQEVPLAHVHLKNAYFESGAREHKTNIYNYCGFSARRFMSSTQDQSQGLGTQNRFVHQRMQSQIKNLMIPP